MNARTFFLPIALLATLASAAVAATPLQHAGRAGDRCKITDPTGTPLNIRTIDKKITGTIGNGQIVYVTDYSADDAGKPWAFIETASGRKLGWVYREFISCF
jgi:hypothetical protein